MADARIYNAGEGLTTLVLFLKFMVLDLEKGPGVA